MLIRMIKTTKGSENGYVVKQYKEGVIYEIDSGLARIFFADQTAVKVKNRRKKRGFKHN